MLQLFEDLGIQERLQWKRHGMIFAMPGVSPNAFRNADIISDESAITITCHACAWSHLDATYSQHFFLHFSFEIRK